MGGSVGSGCSAGEEVALPDNIQYEFAGLNLTQNEKK